MALVELLEARSMGTQRPSSFKGVVETARVSHLEMDSRSEAHLMLDVGASGVCLDGHEDKLLVGDIVGGLRMYDLSKRDAETGALTEIASACDHPGVDMVGGAGGAGTRRRRGQSRRSRAIRQKPAHTATVSSLCWYPVDSGLFVSASFDSKVLVWDAKKFLPVYSFDFGAIEGVLQPKIYSLAMSVVPAAHALVACAGQDHHVRLCDLRTGASSHELSGHRDSVISATWSLSSEYELFTGGRDGCVLRWDIRRGGGAACMGSYDRHNHSGKKSRDRSDPTPLSSVTTATAHAGRVTSLHSPPDAGHGNLLLSCGADNALRLWDIDKYEHKMINYDGIANVASVSTSLISAPGPSGSATVMHANNAGDDVIVAYDVLTGDLVGTLEGSYAMIQSMVYRRKTQEVVSVSSDGSINLWSSTLFATEEGGHAGTDDDDADEL